MIEPMELIQDCVFGRLDNDLFLQNVVVLEERKGVTASDLAQTLGAQTTRGGLKGACIVVEMPELSVEERDAPGPRVNFTMNIRCIEKPLVNRAAGGTNITGEAISIRVLQLLHHYIVKSLPITLSARSIGGIVYDSGEREYGVSVGSMLQLTAPSKMADPVITGSATSVTITTRSPGADIYYTVDGSFPCATNPMAQLVGGALVSQGNEEILGQDDDPILTQAPGTIAVPSGTQVLAVAYPSDPNSQASNLAAATIN